MEGMLIILLVFVFLSALTFHMEILQQGTVLDIALKVGTLILSITYVFPSVRLLTLVITQHGDVSFNAQEVKTFSGRR